MSNFFSCIVFFYLQLLWSILYNSVSLLIPSESFFVYLYDHDKNQKKVYFLECNNFHTVDSIDKHCDSTKKFTCWCQGHESNFMNGRFYQHFYESCGKSLYFSLDLLYFNCCLSMVSVVNHFPLLCTCKGHFARSCVILKSLDTIK